MVLFTELLVGGKAVSSNEHFFQPYKNLTLRRPRISIESEPTREGFKVTLSTDKFARAVYLSTANPAGFFSDNDFDLVPGRKVTVEFRTSHATTAADFHSQLKIRSMVDAF